MLDPKINFYLAYLPNQIAYRQKFSARKEFSIWSSDFI